MEPKNDSSLRVIVRGTLQVTLAMMAAASCVGWLLLGFLARNTAGVWTVAVTIGALTVLYSLLGFALGAVMGRRQRTRGLVSATLGTLLTWGILELFFHMTGIASAELRTPLIFGVPMCVLGGVLGMSRPEDRAALRRELREEMAELESEIEELDREAADASPDAGEPDDE